jgi:predicted transcriptional regulator
MPDDLLAELLELSEQEAEQPGDVTIQKFAEARHISETSAAEWLNRWVEIGLLVRIKVMRTSRQRGFVYRRPEG